MADPVFQQPTGQTVIDGGVLTGVMPTIPLPPDVETLAQDDNSYLGWGCMADWDIDEGLYVNRVMGAYRQVRADPGRMHSGGGTLIVQAVAVRVGQQPAIPSPAGPTNNEVRTRRRIILFNAGKTPGGAPLYGVFVRYVYELQAIPDVGDTLYFPSAPFDTQVSGNYALNPAVYAAALFTTALPSGYGAGAPLVNY